MTRPASVSADLVVTSEPEALAADPVQYMTVALNRAKGWLAEARSIEDVRETKAIAVGYESVIREKELAFDAQLAATEIVRRCERRIGELVREGQREGTITKRGDVGNGRVGHPREDDLRHSAREATGLAVAQLSEHYSLADAPAEQFEQAVTEAREEGNLSRANVVRKVKGEQQPKPERSEWHRKTRRIDSNRILSTLAQELEAATSGLELMDREDLDPALVVECVGVIRRSISIISRHLRRIQP